MKRTATLIISVNYCCAWDVDWTLRGLHVKDLVPRVKLMEAEPLQRGANGGCTNGRWNHYKEGPIGKALGHQQHMPFKTVGS